MARRKLVQIVLLLALTHVLCAAVGLWWLYRNTCATLYSVLEQEAWVDLESALRDLNRTTDSLPLEELKDRLAKKKGESSLAADVNAEFMLVDADWRVTASSTSTLMGSVVAWAPYADAGQRPGEPRHGRIALPGGHLIAAACPLKGNTGHLLAYASEAPLRATQAKQSESLPSLALLTLLWTCVPVMIVIYMVARHYQEAMERERQTAQADAMRQACELLRTRDAIIVGLAKLAESRDPETGDHLERISAYAVLLAAALAEHPRFREQITPTFIKLIGSSSVLHDIGKVGVPDSILLKCGPLTESEKALMQHHAGIGGRCLREIERRMGTSNYLQMAREIALLHHERWDGTGYPDGLAGEEIPLAARIVALADVYDALSTRRPYKEAFPHEKCVALIREERGRQFDPDMVDVWLTIEAQCRDINRRYAAAGTSPHGVAEKAPATLEEEALAVGAGSGA